MNFSCMNVYGLLEQIEIFAENTVASNSTASTNYEDCEESFPPDYFDPVSF